MRNLEIVILLFVAINFFSCTKTSSVKVSGNAEWIKVIDDYPVFFPGKIRADADNNLFCSFNYRDDEVDSNSAIIKLDSTGNVVWTKKFANLAIYDFLVTAEGDVVIASFSNGSVTLTKLFSSDTSITQLLGSYLLPSNTGSFIGVGGMKIFLTSDKSHYNISGTIYYDTGGENNSVGFIVSTTLQGEKVWLKTYPFESNIRFTTITGCAEAADGSFRLFGNRQEKNKYLSYFFIMRYESDGTFDWIKYFPTDTYNATNVPEYTGYYCYTSDIIPDKARNSFFACAFNEKFNFDSFAGTPIYTTDDNSARIFRLNSDTIILDTGYVDYDFQNMVADLILTDDGIMVGLNPLKLAGVYYAGQQNAFIARLSNGLDIQSVSRIQNQYMDYFSSLCRMPGGQVAIESIIQSFGKDNYRLEVIKTDENGNF